MNLDLTDDEKLALVDLLKRTIRDDPYPLSPRIRTLQGILDRFEPPAAVAAEPPPRAKPGDRPRAALAAISDAGGGEGLTHPPGAFRARGPRSALGDFLVLVPRLDSERDGGEGEECFHCRHTKRAIPLPRPVAVGPLHK